MLKAIVYQTLPRAYASHPVPLYAWPRLSSPVLPPTRVPVNVVDSTPQMGFAYPEQIAQRSVGLEEVTQGANPNLILKQHSVGSNPPNPISRNMQEFASKMQRRAQQSEDGQVTHHQL